MNSQSYQPHEQKSQCNQYYNVKSINKNIPKLKNTEFNKNIFKHNTTNGGLYSGPQNNNEWGHIHITPTSDNYIKLFQTLNGDIKYQQASLPRYGNNTVF